MRCYIYIIYIYQSGRTSTIPLPSIWNEEWLFDDERKQEEYSKIYPSTSFHHPAKYQNLFVNPRKACQIFLCKNESWKKIFCLKLLYKPTVSLFCIALKMLEI